MLPDVEASKTAAEKETFALAPEHAQHYPRLIHADVELDGIGRSQCTRESRPLVHRRRSASAAEASRVRGCPSS